GLTTTLKNAWTTSRQVNFFWVANFNLKFGYNKIHFKIKKTKQKRLHYFLKSDTMITQKKFVRTNFKKGHT
ncbi:hypothetical protein Q7W06_02360, partial [Streptococcus suis]|nr:hypothetical protein [Streptococcus suis]